MTFFIHIYFIAMAFDNLFKLNNHEDTVAPQLATIPKTAPLDPGAAYNDKNGRK